MARTTLQPQDVLFDLDDLDVQAPTLQTHLARSWRAVKHALSELDKSKTAFIGAMMLVVLFLVCLLTPYIDRYSPIAQNYRELLQPPSAKHYFGTDRYGRDIWSRVLWGGRRLVVISICAVAWGLLLGIPVGALSGYYGGWIDTVTMRCVDAWLAIPGADFSRDRDHYQ